MKTHFRRAFISVGAIAGMVLGQFCWQLQAAEEGGFKSLFNGKDLSGWRVPEPNPFWTVKDGVLVGVNDTKNSGHLLLTEEAGYQDFILESEARWTGEIDSGFFFRQPQLQLQLGISRSLKTDMTCSFYTGGKDKYPEAGRAKGLEKVFKPGEWNSYRIQVKGDSYTVWCNGQKVTEYTDAKYGKAGPVGLQIHPGLPMRVEFRNVRIKPL